MNQSLFLISFVSTVSAILFASSIKKSVDSIIERFHDFRYGKGVTLEGEKCPTFIRIVQKIITLSEQKNARVGHIRYQDGKLMPSIAAFSTPRCSVGVVANNNSAATTMVTVTTRVLSVDDIHKIVTDTQKEMGLLIESGHVASHTRDGTFLYPIIHSPKIKDVYNKEVIAQLLNTVSIGEQANFLLYGSTGSGKSTIIKAISEMIGACVIVTSLDEFDSLSEFRLFINKKEYTAHSPIIGNATVSLMRPKKKIILFEDIDKKVPPEFWQGLKVPRMSFVYSDLLSLLDGIIDNDNNSYIFFTAGNLNSLPAEFCRAGRMYKCMIPKVSKCSIVEFVEDHYNVIISPEDINVDDALLADLYYYKNICTNHIDFLAKLNEQLDT